MTLEAHALGDEHYDLVGTKIANNRLWEGDFQKRTLLTTGTQKKSKKIRFMDTLFRFKEKITINKSWKYYKTSAVKSYCLNFSIPKEALFTIHDISKSLAMIPFSSVAVFLKRTQGAAREYPMTDSDGDLVVFRPFL